MSSNQYLLFNKPDGVLTTFTDEEGRETLKEDVDVSGVYTAGRLYHASEPAPVAGVIKSWCAKETDSA